MNRIINKNLDDELSKLVMSNLAKIKSITPKNPIILENDEWNAESQWDNLYKELKNK